MEIPRRPGGTPTLKAVGTWSLLAAVFVIGALALLPRVFGPPGLFDEGFVVSGAMMIRRGWLPIRDFFVIYGPGQYYLTAAVFSVFGEDLAIHRALYVVTLALLGGVLAWYSFIVADKRATWLVLMGAFYVQVAAFALPSPGYAAVASVLMLVLSALGFSCWVGSGSTRQLLQASLLVGLAGLLRWDFGIFGIVAHLIALVVVIWARGMDRRDAMRSALCVLGPWLLVMAVAFAPFVHIGGALRWFEEVPRFAVLEFSQWRGRPFVAPQLALAREAMQTGDFGRLAKAGLGLGLAALPFVLAPAAALLAIVRLKRSKATDCEVEALVLVLALCCLGLLNQMRVRPGLNQGFPAIVSSLPLAVYLLRSLPDGRGVVGRALGRLPFWSALVLSVLTCYTAQDKLRGVFGRGVEFDLPRASYTRLTGADSSVTELRDYTALIRHLRSTTADGEPILSAAADMSRLFINDAMLYFLTDRPSATRWIEMEPGLTNTDLAQRELCVELQRGQVRTLVLWDKRSDEPNASARSNGVRVLDDCIRTDYAERQRFGSYTVLSRRTGDEAGTTPAPTPPVN